MAVNKLGFYRKDLTERQYYIFQYLTRSSYPEASPVK